jgi:hypothetical protein
LPPEFLVHSGLDAMRKETPYVARNGRTWSSWGRLVPASVAVGGELWVERHGHGFD